MVLSPTAEPTATPAPTETPGLTSTPFPEIELNLDLPEGDAEAGLVVANMFQCIGCHTNPVRGPAFTSINDMPAMLERGELRIASSDYTGRATTSQEYILESIFLPEIHLVPGEWARPMSQYALDFITEQELADLLAWLESQN